MRIIGLDLSIARTGVAVVDEKGAPIHIECITTKASQPENVRIAEIRKDIGSIIKAGNVKRAILEQPFIHPANRRGRVQLLALHGVINHLLHEMGIRSIGVPPARLKAFVAGNGRATKETMINAVNRRWRVNLKDHNAADALGLAKLGWETWNE